MAENQTDLSPPRRSRRLQQRRDSQVPERTAIHFGDPADWPIVDNGDGNVYGFHLPHIRSDIQELNPLTTDLERMANDDGRNGLNSENGDDGQDDYGSNHDDNQIGPGDDDDSNAELAGDEINNNHGNEPDERGGDSGIIMGDDAAAGTSSNENESKFEYETKIDDTSGMVMTERFEVPPVDGRSEPSSARSRGSSKSGSRNHGRNRSSQDIRSQDIPRLRNNPRRPSGRIGDTSHYGNRPRNYGVHGVHH